MYAEHISDDLKDSNGKTCYAWAVPAKFSPLCNMFDDLQYLDGDKTPLTEQETNRMMANVQLLQTNVS